MHELLLMTVIASLANEMGGTASAIYFLQFLVAGVVLLEALAK